MKRHHLPVLTTLAAWAFLLGVLVGCGMFEPGPEGDKARKTTGDAIRALVPAPWGELLATGVVTLSGAVAASKHKQAGQAVKLANANHKMGEAAIFGLEQVYQDYKQRADAGDVVAKQAVATLKQAKQAAQKASKMFEVPEHFERTVDEVRAKNGFRTGPSSASPAGSAPA